MNGFSPSKCRRVFHIICFTAIAYLFCVSAQAGEPIEMMLHKDDVYGARDIEAGNYAKGVERLLTRVVYKGQAVSRWTPIVNDLCAGYTMLKDFEAATKYCDAAVANGWATGLALNNRGALHAGMGDYENAILDFRAAIEARGADSIARRNLGRIETRVAAMLRTNDSMVAQVTPSAK
jgi:tetratricopeptide (TPR) repeat protein